MSAAEYRGRAEGQPKQAWHGHLKRAEPERRSADGVVFDSIDERDRWLELQRLQELGFVRKLRRQVKYPLVIDGRPVLIRSERYPEGRRASYRADFAYERRHTVADPWEAVVEERKTGWDDPASRLRRAVVEAIYQIRIEVTAGAQRARRRR